jgi:hypothetical protein
MLERLHPGDVRAVQLLLAVASALAWYRRRPPAEIDLADAAYLLNRLPDRSDARPTSGRTMIDVDALCG